VLTDGRETPPRPIAGDSRVKDFGVKVYPVAVGSDKRRPTSTCRALPCRQRVQGRYRQREGDVRGTGYERSHVVSIVLKDKKTERRSPPDGKARARVRSNDQPVEAELQFKPTEVGTLISLSRLKRPGEVDGGTTALAQVAVLTPSSPARRRRAAREYRYSRMMIRDRRSTSPAC
jgi:hypothetical protein